MAKDKDPILDEKFFGLLHPIIYPDASAVIRKHAYEEDMVKHRLFGAGKLLEAAISKKKGLERHDTVGRDFVDGSDAKSSSVRWTFSGTKYSAPIRDIFNKKGLLRCVIYERLTDTFYFFLIPGSAYAHIPKSSNIEINFNLDGTPNRKVSAKTIVNWWDFEVDGFDGILQDIELPFENYKTKRSEKKARELLEKETKKQLRLLKASQPKKRSAKKTKIGPTQENASLYIQSTLEFEIQDLVVPQPNVLSLKS